MSIYNIALTGVMANQIGMNVTAQNTANMNTDGYSRQVVDQSAIVYGNGVGGYNVGGGVSVSSIRRVSDQAAIERLRLANQDAEYATSFVHGMTNIENVFDMDGLNINLGMNDFFASVDNATLQPESPVYRNQLINEANELAKRFTETSSQLDTQLRQLVNEQSTITDTVNAQLDNIAKMNEEIRVATGQGKDTAGLQDSLDVQLNELSKKLGVKTLYKEDGTVEVSTLSGQPLVNGKNCATLAQDPTNSDPYNTDLVLTFQDNTVALKMPAGGELQAIDELKNDQYIPISEKMDDIAAGFADAVNEALAGGTDLNGTTPGKPLFSYDPADPAGTISITDITADELALSADGEIGNGDILNDISDISTGKIDIGGEQMNVYDAYSQLLGTIGIATNSANQSYETATISLNEAQAARDSVSAVSSNEEAANLMMYMNAYEANMKVLSTANQMFDSILNSF